MCGTLLSMKRTQHMLKAIDAFWGGWDSSKSTLNTGVFPSLLSLDNMSLYVVLSHHIPTSSSSSYKFRVYSLYVMLINEPNDKILECIHIHSLAQSQLRMLAGQISQKGRHEFDSEHFKRCFQSWESGLTQLNAIQMPSIKTTCYSNELLWVDKVPQRFRCRII